MVVTSSGKAGLNDAFITTTDDGLVHCASVVVEGSISVVVGDRPSFVVFDEIAVVHAHVAFVVVVDVGGKGEVDSSDGCPVVCRTDRGYPGG